VHAVPDGLGDRVGEAEVEQVLHRLLAEEVVDAEDRALVEDLLQRAVDGLRARQVASERLLDHHTRAGTAARGAEPRGDLGKQARRNRKVVAGARRVAERPAQRRERGVVAVVAVHELQLGLEAAQRLGVRVRIVAGEALAHPGDQRVAPGAAAGHAHHDLRQAPAPLQVLERGEDLLVGEVAGDAEDHQRIAQCRVRGSQALPVRWWRETGHGSDRIPAFDLACKPRPPSGALQRLDELQQVTLAHEDRQARHALHDLRPLHEVCRRRREACPQPPSEIQVLHIRLPPANNFNADGEQASEPLYRGDVCT